MHKCPSNQMCSAPSSGLPANPGLKWDQLNGGITPDYTGGTTGCTWGTTGYPGGTTCGPVSCGCPGGITGDG